MSANNASTSTLACNADAIPLPNMNTSNSSSLAVVEVSSNASISSTSVKGLEAAILRSYSNIIHPLHVREELVNNVCLPWLSNYRQLGEEYQDCVDHSAELAYGELAFLNYLIDTDLSEENDVQIRSFVQDMRDEILEFMSKLKILQKSSSQLWSRVPVNEDEQDPIQAAIDQFKGQTSEYCTDKQKLAEGVEMTIRCQPDFAVTIDKLVLHWRDHYFHFETRVRQRNAILSVQYIDKDREQRVSTQNYITAIHATVKEYNIYFAKTNLFVKNLSSRAVSKPQKDSIALPSFYKTQFMETIGAPIFAHAAKQLKHIRKLTEAKVLAELISVRYLSEGKYRIGVAIEVASQALSQQISGDVECRCKSLQVDLGFNHASHRKGGQLSHPEVMECEPQTGKLNADEIKTTLTSRATGRVPVFTFIEGYRDKKEEYTTRHGVDVINSKHNVDDSGIASGATWVINEDSSRDFKYAGIPGIPLSVDLRPDDSHQVLVTVNIKATFSLRVKILPGVYIPGTRVIEVNQKDRFVNLAVWSVKECNSEAQKEQVSLKLNVVKDSVQIIQPS